MFIYIYTETSPTSASKGMGRFRYLQFNTPRNPMLMISIRNGIPCKLVHKTHIY